eukprot:305571-Amphidinium_carterae.1
MLQAGQWSLVPTRLIDDTETLCCRVHVATDYMETQLLERGPSSVSRQYPFMVKQSDGSLAPLCMRHLHGQEVQLRKPYMRAMLLKNMMASSKHSELPCPLHPKRIGVYKQ